MKRTIVVARWNEDVSWLDKLTGIEKFVVQKGVHLPNQGREASSYLWYILTHWQSLEGRYVFCQGSPFYHCPDFYRWIELSGEINLFWYSPHKLKARSLLGPDSHLNMCHVCTMLGLPMQSEYEFYAGAMFQVSTNIIKQRSEEFYKKAYSISMNRSNAPWELERLWSYIFCETPLVGVVTPKWQPLIGPPKPPPTLSPPPVVMID